eukprot:TRINITY_DN48170_c0_g1_i1.p2 TRINITY_DN48170_c0_g1~~TRINITY_DN48170_c0_g1_i1.p2  ORF type:complete len:270 (+),score=48.23 TRINITY_DN48170_c0_g1_i1:103-810(+)
MGRPCTQNGRMSATVEALTRALDITQGSTNVAGGQCSGQLAPDQGDRAWRCGCGRAFKTKGWALRHQHKQRAAAAAGAPGEQRWLHNILLLRRAAVGGRRGGVPKPRLTLAAKAVLQPAARRRLAAEAAALAEAVSAPPHRAAPGHRLPGGAVALCADLAATGAVRLLPEHPLFTVPRRERGQRRNAGRVAACAARCTAPAAAAPARGGGGVVVAAAAELCKSWVSGSSSRSSSH